MSVALASATLAAVGGAVLTATPAQAVAGTPAAPTVIYQENFENRPAASNLLLNQYIGATGTTYTSDPYWTSREACNGFIIDYSSPKQPADCTGVNGRVYPSGPIADDTAEHWYDALTALPYALGVIAGSSNPATNAAVSAFTTGSGPNNAIEFQTQAPISLPAATGRFVTFSVDVAESSCGSADHPQLMFYLRNSAGVDTPVTTSPITPCGDPRTQTFNVTTPGGQVRTVSAGSFASDSSTLFTGSSLGIVMRNQDGQEIGNDAAFDNIKVLDVTPTLDKSFSPASVPVGGTSTLTFTVTNTSELGAKAGWAFTDSLPTGLTVAANPNIGGTCQATTAAAAGSSSIDLTNGVLNAGETSCTVTVDVTSTTPTASDPVSKTYTNGAANMTSLVGLNPPADATVEFHTTPALTVQKSASPTTIAQAGDQVTYSFLVTNTGNSDLSNIAVNETSFTGTGTPPVVTCPVTTLAPGASTTCTATYTATQADANAGTIGNTATAQGTPPGTTTPVTSPGSSATVTVTPAPALTVTKSASPNDTAHFTVGQVITYSFAVTNTGNVTMSNVTVADSGFTGAGPLSPISCPSSTASMAPGATATCTATYTITQADVDAGKISNDATAQGTAPGATTPTTSPSSHVDVPGSQNPALSVVKSASPTTLNKAGDKVTYLFTVTNTGNVTMSNIAVNETSFTGTGTAPVVSCPATPSSLVPGAQVTCTATYTATQADVDAGSITNTATAQGTAPGSTTPTVSPASTATVTVPPAPALTVMKTANPTTVAMAGDTVSYSFLVTNTGNVTMSNVAVNESSFTGTGTAPVVSCPTTVLAPASSVTCTATYTATQADVDAGSITNTATAQGTAPGATTPTVSPASTATVAATPAPALSVVKSASPSDPASFKVGQVVTYSFAVTNTGNVTMSNVSVADTGFTGSGMLSPVSCPAGAASLAPGASVTCTATYTITQADVDAGKISNDATAQGTPPGSTTPTTSPKSHVDIPAAQKPALSLVKSATPASTGKAGDKVMYSFLVTNTGNVTMTDVKVDEGAFTGTSTAPVVSCPAGVASLAPGASVTCTASYVLTQADVDNGSVTNTATAQGVPPTPAGSTTPPAPVKSPASTATVSSDPAPGLSVVKTASKGTVSAGDKITYSFLVTNTGNVTMTGVSVKEEGFNGAGTLSAVSCPAEAASLAPGAKVTCTATYTVDASDVGAGTLVNTASATGKTPTGVAVHSAGSSAKVMVVDSTKILAYTGAGGGILVSFLGAITLLGGLAIMVIARRRRHQQ